MNTGLGWRRLRSTSNHHPVRNRYHNDHGTEQTKRHLERHHTPVFATEREKVVDQFDVEVEVH
jgi:hypothetical protein